MRLTGTRVVAIWIGGTIAEFVLLDWIETAASRSQPPAVPGVVQWLIAILALEIPVVLISALFLWWAQRSARPHRGLRSAP